MIDVKTLRKNIAGNQQKWSDQELLNGLIYFYELKGYFPAAHEIDDFPYLPTARSIQRTNGGLVQLRRRLLPGQIDNYTKGITRSNKARQADLRARRYEEKFYKFLVTHFKPLAVHEHKIIRPGNVASDFFIYLNESAGITLDLFYAQDIRSLARIVHIKQKRYSVLPFETYFILVGNNSITNKEINLKMKNRTFPLPDHINVISELSFKESIIYSIKNRSIYAING